jgi:dihydrofolate reductase
MNLSLDGFMSGPRDELDWHVESWSKEMAEKLLELLDDTDTLIFGRVTYEAMSNYWTFRPLDQDFPSQDQAIADQMNRHEKNVFAGKMTPTPWKNTRVVNGDITEEITRLRSCHGKNILIFGSGKLVSSCISSGLVDEYRLWIHPVLLGKGNPLFNNLKERIILKLTNACILNPGIALMHYQPLT